MPIPGLPGFTGVTPTGFDVNNVALAAGRSDLAFFVNGIEVGRAPSGTPTGALVWGNESSLDYWPGTGGNGYTIPFRVQHQFGRTGGVVLGTTQAVGLAARYFNSTQDDSAEAGSCQVYIADDYNAGINQTKAVVGWEGDAVAQGAVTISGATLGLIGVAAAIKLQLGNITGLAPTVTSGINFYAAGGTNVAGSTLTNFYGLYVEAPTWTVTPTNQWGVYSKLDIQTEKRLLVNVFGAQTNTAQALIAGPNVSGGATDVPSLIVQAGAGQTAPTLSVNTSGASRRFQVFGATGNLLLGNGPTGGSGVGIISMLTTTAPSGTPPASSAYLYVDPADSKLKAKTSGGTVTILTPVI